LPEAIDAVSNEPGCHGASCRQFDEVDNQILYAALIVAVSCVKVLPILDKYAVTTDGLSAYLDIQDTYDNTGNLLLKIAELIERFQTPWSPGYVGGVPAYLDHICGAFGLMDREDIDFLHHPLYSEGQKISNVYSRFRNSEQSQLMETVHNKFQADVHQHTVPATVDSFVMQIKSSHRYLSAPTAIPRIRGSRSAMLGAVHEDFGDIHAYMASGANIENKPFYVPLKIWSIMSLQSKALKIRYPEYDLIVDFLERRKVAQEEDTVNAKTKSHNKPSRLPGQYATAKAKLSDTTTIEELDDDGEPVHSSDDEPTANDLAAAYNTVIAAYGTTNSYACPAWTSSRAHLEWTLALNSQMEDAGLYICISDSGADTCILGDGWHVMHTHARVVNILGFDQHARKR